MKAKVLFFVSISILGFSQSRDYKKRLKSDSFRFLTQTEEIFYVKDIISKSTEFGYELLRLEDGEIMRKSYPANFIILTKSLRDQYPHSFFPSWSVGTIVKKVFFLGTNLEKAIQICVITEIDLIEYSNVSSSTINNFNNSTIKYLIDHISLKYNIVSNKKVFEKPLYELYNENKYSYVDEIKYNYKKNDFTFDGTFSYATRSELVPVNDGSYNRHIYLGFQHNDTHWEDLVRLTDFSKSVSSNKKDTLKNLRDNIGDTNIEDINTYDLQEMVQFFLDDCKRSNIKVPKIETLSATFEPLDEGVIALAYGMNDDDKIIIRVDPSAWQNSGLIKKWYVLYHELGHDVLNLDHGEGGKMMFNFADRDYNWDEFYIDKEYMFNYKLKRQ
tara:strand:+ start:402 stop:1559 length:1158 start_codon:yes stop_codon:yes gene_type:complete